MIKIREETPLKIPGATSLFLSFNYNEKIIDIIKKEPIKSFDSKTKEWELPLTSLSNILDELTFIDDIELNLKKEIEETNNIKPILSYKTKSFQHQLDAVNYGLNHKKWLLLDAPGLGKSKSIINLAEELKEQKGIKHCLIVCGVASLRLNWKIEIEKHSNLSYRVLGEKISKKGNLSYNSLDERIEELEKGINEFFIITNIENFRDKKVKKLITKGKNKGKYKTEITCPLLDIINDENSSIDMIVIDEAHKVKDPESQQGKNFLQLNSEYKIAATGTLLVNNPLDAYVPLKWIGKEHSSLGYFKNQFCIYNGLDKNDGRIVGFKNLKMLKEEIDSCSLRRTKDLLDLPPKTIIEEYVELNDDQKEFYQNIVAGVKKECEKIKLKPDNTLAMTTRLRQATALPSILTTKNISSSKIDRCIDLVEQLISQNEKVVIMSSFKETVMELKERLNKYNPLICTGDSKETEIDENKKLFQEDNEHNIIICTWQKMGTGHTLNRASYMVFIDTPYTEALFSQSCDRIHRIGSTKPVFIYNLINIGTIDEKVASLIKKKKALSDYIVDDVLDSTTYEILKQYIEEL